MSLGLHDPERRYRRRLRARIVRIGLYLALLGVAAALAYRSGVERVEAQRDRLAVQITQLQAALSALEQDAIRLEAEARTARVQYAELLQRYEREVPLGEKRMLADLVAERLDEGVTPGRLAFVIAAADEPRDCGAAETKRFILPTPAYSGPNTAVTFADGRITVTGRGDNAREADGSVVGWFDPAREVAITFTVIGGERSSVTGHLPLHHALVLGEEEYRFSVVAGERSFVNVTADHCPFP